LIKFLQHRIADPRMLRVIQKWLTAGVLEDGKIEVGDRGTPQGGVISPLLANVYLHYRGIAFGNGVDRLGLVRGSGDGFHCLAGCSRNGWTPWISLLAAGKVWKTREPAMPGCMTSTSF